MGQNSSVDFLEEFDVFDDKFEDISGFGDLGENSGDLNSAPLSTSSFMPPTSGMASAAKASLADNGDRSGILEEEMFSLSTTADPIPTFASPTSAGAEPAVSVEQGWLSFFENASLKQKQIYTVLSGWSRFSIGDRRRHLRHPSRCVALIQNYDDFGSRRSLRCRHLRVGKCHLSANSALYPRPAKPV
uniref:Uncharacterized protein n=1 Tax=Desertifilum tharense IPPAS B-1220 TaxID=1781255 RepID=A0ACD5GN63_9CYAN